jgi:hypothetical protein
MLPVNLSTRNTRNNTVPNPIPFDDVLFAMLLCFNCAINVRHILQVSK